MKMKNATLTQKEISSMAKAELVAILNQNGISFVESTDKFGQEMVGIKTSEKRSVYHWFECMPAAQYAGKGFPPMIKYNHSYSQNTGRTHRSWSYKMAAQNFLEKVTGAPFYGVL